jgi:hypothetical protein
MFTAKILIEKGIKEPKSRSFCNYTLSYCKLWSVGNFNLRINKKGHLEVFETVNGALIKVIKDIGIIG